MIQRWKEAFSDPALIAGTGSVRNSIKSDACCRKMVYYVGRGLDVERSTRLKASYINRGQSRQCFAAVWARALVPPIARIVLGTISSHRLIF